MNNSKLFSLKNKVAIITGATGLIGKYHASALAKAGAGLIVTDLDIKECKLVCSSLKTEAYPFAADLSKKEEIVKLLDYTISKFNKVDILVNNAAINDKFEDPISSLEMSKFENYPLDLWNKVMDINITSVMLTCQVIGTYMAKRKSGSIINICSTYGIVAPDQSLYKDKEGKQMFYKSVSYPVTKGAVLSLTKYLAAYWGESNIRVNAISPGGVENGQSQFFKDSYSKKTPLKRMAQPDEFSGALIFLASDASSYVTGENIVVDGGFTIW